MGLYTVKQRIKNFILTEIFIDQWSVRTPINIPKIVDGVYYPSVAAIEAPVSDYSVEGDGFNTLYSEAEFGVDVAWRFNGEASFHELPITIAENLIDWVSCKAVQCPQLFGENVFKVSVENTANPVLISRADSEDKDWLVYGFLRFLVGFRPKPIDPNDLEGIQPDIDRTESILITSVGIKTYKEFQDEVIDKEIILP